MESWPKIERNEILITGGQISLFVLIVSEFADSEKILMIVDADDSQTMLDVSSAGEIDFIKIIEVAA